MIIIGDLHKCFNLIEQYAVEKDIKNDAFIQVGDIGIASAKEYLQLKILNDFLIKSKNKLYCLQGNHDNPLYFKGNHDFSNIKFVKNYSVVKIQEYNVLFLGGAVSIDRLDPVYECFENSPFLYDEKKLKKLKNVDMVVSHTAPRFCNPRTVSKIVEECALNDKALLEDIAKERADLENAFDILLENNKLIYWWYGHFHFDANGEVFNDVNFQLAGIGRFLRLIKNEQ
jgi:UDP-2,3-diacylglucosamine pyrophosphatase LpxH